MKITTVPKDNSKEICFYLQGRSVRPVFFRCEDQSRFSPDVGGALGLRRRPHLFEDLSADTVTVLTKRDTQLLKSRCYCPAMQQNNLKILSTSLHIVQGKCGMTCLHFPRLRKKVRGVRRRDNFKNLKGLVSNLLVYYGTSFVRREGAFKS